jgi:aminoglycoside phosphotransferase (APT) family kinase protein
MTLPDFDGLLDWTNLQAWIDAQSTIPGAGAITTVEQLTGGSQNNIFRMARASGDEIVLRRPPRHLRTNSNDTMLREARVLGALADSNVPHPRFYASCADTDIIGVCFYVMQPIDGFMPMGALPGEYATNPEWRRRIGYELVEGAAKLGAVDHEAVGLTDFGKAEAWIDRQVSRWRSQLDSYSQLDGYDTPDIPEVDRVGNWIEANKPSSCQIGIIHGDYQFANVMFAPNEPKLAAIIDWELSTLGDPLLDLAWLLQAWHEPSDPPGKLMQLQQWDDSMPSRQDLIDHYANVSGRDVSAMPWFFVLACYKLGILLEGTYARACAGLAPKEIGDQLHAYTLWLFASANQSLSI